MGGKFHLKLNIGGRPIANKYREGKMKRTLKRELKVLEIAGREADAVVNASRIVGHGNGSLGGTARGTWVEAKVSGVSSELCQHQLCGWQTSPGR